MLEEQMKEDCNNFRPKINKKSMAKNNNNTAHSEAFKSQ